MSELQGPRIPGEERSGRRRPLGWIIGGLLALLLLALLIPFACQALGGEGQIRKAKAPGDNRRPLRRRPKMGKVAVTPGTQRALRTWAPLVPERMLRRSPQGAMARKTVNRARQKRMVLARMVLPEA
jgi:hypothetical protein